MNCPTCGTALGAADAACPICAGAPVAGAPPAVVAAEPVSVVQMWKGIAGGMAGALLGAFVWFGIVKLTNLKVGYVAWGIGIAAGFGVVLLSGRRGVTLQMIGAATSLFGYLIGELMIFKWLLPAVIAKESGRSIEEAEKVIELLGMTFVDYMKAEMTDGKGAVFTLLFLFLAVSTGWGIPKERS